MSGNESTESGRYTDDPWPKMPDGEDFDGEQLLGLVRSGNSPFRGAWDVNLLIREIEENLDTQVVDIPVVSKGSNNYVSVSSTIFHASISSMLKLGPDNAQGFHFKLSNRPDVVARLARGDVNMPDFDGFPMHRQVPEAMFEVAVYELLLSEPQILASRLLYKRFPVQHVAPRPDVPQDIVGRRLFLFQRTEGESSVWRNLGAKERVCAYFTAPLNPAHLRKVFSRPVFSLSQPVSAHHCSTLIFR